MKTIFTRKNEQIIIVGKLAPDKMKLFVDVEPVQAASITKEQLIAVIREFSQQAELHEAVIDDIVKNLHQGEKVLERRIAKGTPPENGSDGKLVLLVKKLTDRGSVKVNEKGYADYRELHLFDNVQTGQPVARVYPPKNGVDGRDALGAPIKSQAGKPIKPNLDKSLKLTPVNGEDFQVLAAQNDGYLEEEGGKLSVRPELIVKGDLDLHVGNINFIGAVKILGSVIPGMIVQAKKGIEVIGEVRSATFICPEGDIKIKGFFFGGERSRVSGGKGFYAGVVQEANVEVQGEIRIEKEAVDSTLRTQSTFLASAGHCIGGSLFVVCGAEAKQWGNEAAKRTEISLCSDVEVRADFAKIIQAIRDHDKALDLIKLHLGPYATNAARIQLLHQPHREKMEKLLKKMREIEASRVKLLASKEAMLEQAKRNHVPRVNVLGALYPGVVIRAGDKAFETKEELKGPKSIDYIAEKEAFEQHDLLPVQCLIEGQNPSAATAQPAAPDNKKSKGETHGKGK